MKPSVKVALVCSLISIGITLVFFYSGKSDVWFAKGALVNLFLLISAIGVGVFLYKKSEGFSEKGFVDDLKMAMQGGIVFTIMVSGFTYFYYSKIEVNLLEDFRQEKLAEKKALIPNEAAYLEMQKTNPNYKDKTYMDFMENEEDKGSFSMNAKIITLFHSILGMLFSVVFSIFVTITKSPLSMFGLY